MPQPYRATRQRRRHARIDAVDLKFRRTKADAVEMESARAATVVCSLPPCGGGLGRGVVVMAQSCIRQLLPPPPTPPHKGEGSTPCVSQLSCIQLNGTRFRAFSGKVDCRFSAENATTQRNLERVSAPDRFNLNGTRSEGYSAIEVALSGDNRADRAPTGAA